MIRSVTTTDDAPPAPSPVWFVLLEALVIGAIPLLGVLGFQTLLSSRLGTFVAQPGPDDPGWAALVAPSPVTAVVYRTGETVDGVALVAQPGEGADGGAVVLIPPNLVVDGSALNTLRPDDAVDRLAADLDLALGDPLVMTSGDWADLLGAATLEVDNPDPIPVEVGEVELEIGPLDLAAADVARFVGRPSSEGPAEAIVVRVERVWAAIVELAGGHELDEEHPLGEILADVASGDVEIDVLPTVAGADGLVVDTTPAEELVRRVVAFPAGADGGSRAVVQILARGAGADLEALASEVGGLGVEVVAIGNADPFDGGATELVVPYDADPERYSELAEHFGGASVVRVATEEASPDVATLLVAPDASTS